MTLAHTIIQKITQDKRSKIVTHTQEEQRVYVLYIHIDDIIFTMHK